MGINQNFIEQILRDTDKDRYRYQSYRSFILLWLLFEYWVNYLMGSKPNVSVQEMLEWFKTKPNYLKDHWKDIDIVGYVKVLHDHCPVGDKRYTPPRSPKTIKDYKNPNLNEVIDVLNRFRGNLIHGKEDITNNDNVDLYAACGHILHRWLYTTYWDLALKNKL